VWIKEHCSRVVGRTSVAPPSSSTETQPFPPTFLLPSRSACPSRVLPAAVRPSTAFSRSCIVTQRDKWHWRRRCSLRVHPGGPRLACSCARRSVRQTRRSPIGLAPCVLPACCSETRSAKYVEAGVEGAGQLPSPPSAFTFLPLPCSRYRRPSFVSPLLVQDKSPRVFSASACPCSVKPRYASRPGGCVPPRLCHFCLFRFYAL
jgi:hypothetical protein